MVSVVASVIIVTATVTIRSLTPWPWPLAGSPTPPTIGASMGLALATALLLSVWSLVSGGVRAAARRNLDRLILLTHLGAADAALETPLREQGFLSAALGAVLGAAAAALGVAVLIWSPGTMIGLAARGLSVPAMDPIDLVGVAAWPAVVMVVAAGSAALAARAAVRRLA